MKTFKKYLSIILAVLMISTACPMTALADAVDIDGSDEFSTWSYTAENDTLYINGEYLYIQNNGLYPTYQNGALIRFSFSHLVIGKDVKVIQYAVGANVITSFNTTNYNQKYDVTFEEGSQLETIGDYAFYKTTITSITLPETVTYIGSYSFSDAPYLRYADMSAASATTLFDQTFVNDDAIEEIKLPHALTAVPFKCCYMLTNLVSIEIPDTVTEIGAYAFQNCRNLELNSLPESLTSVGEYAFSSCYNSHFEVKPTVTAISKYAFISSGVTKVELTDCFEIYQYAFYNCRSLTDVRITGVGNMYDSTFSYCSSLENVYIAGQLGWIRSAAFAECISLKNVDITNCDSLGKIDTGAFKGCTSLEELILPSSITEFGEGAFENTPALRTVNINNTNVTKIPAYLFKSSGIEKVIIPETVTVINSQAFANCPNLKEVSFPIKMTTFGSTDAFNYTSVEKLTVYNRGMDFSSNPSFLNSLTEITAYADSTAETYANANNITFTPLDEGGIPQTQLRGTHSAGTWYVRDGSSELVIQGSGAMTSNVIYDIEGTSKTFAQLVDDYDITSVYIKEGITTIPYRFLYYRYPSGTYSDVSSVTEVTLPSTITSIGSYSFQNTSLESIVIPDSVTTIGDNAFDGAGLAGGVTLSNSLTTIGYRVFNGCKFTSLVIPDSVTSIDNYALYDCQKLNEITIPASVESFGNYSVGYYLRSGSVIKNVNLLIRCVYETPAYNYATSNGFRLDVTMPEGYIGGYMAGKNLIRWYYYPETKALYVLSVGNNSPFSGSTSNGSSVVAYDNGTPVQQGDLDVDTVYFADNCKTFCPLVSGKTVSPLAVFNPKRVELATKTTTIRSYAFSGCTALEEVVIPASSATFSGSTCFENCNIKRLTINSSIPYNLFMDNKSLEAVVLGDKCTEIGENAFKNCTNLKYLDLNKAKYIRRYAFYGCTSLEQLTIPSTVYGLSEYAFAKCMGVKELTINSGVQLNTNVFSDLIFCDTININTNINSHVSSNAFKNIGASTTGVVLKYDGNATNAYTPIFNGYNVTKLVLGAGVKSAYFGMLSNLTEFVVSPENEYLFTYKGCLYKNNGNDTVSFLKAPSTYTTVEFYDGPIDCIESCAFAFGNIKNLTIPEGVVNIEEEAFFNCRELRKINLPTTLEYIGEYAFAHCQKLKILSIPSCIEIGGAAFEDCMSLASVLLPKNLEYIDNDAFIWCDALTSIVIPESCIEIGTWAFEDCVSLTDVYMYETSFKRGTFYECKPELTIHTMAGSVPYGLARQWGINVEGYTDEDLFADTCAMMEDIYEGYLGFCDGEHGDIQYLTVYEPTCTQDGYIIGVCEYCSVILEEKHIEAPGHDYVNTVSIPATDSTQAVEKYECKNCGDTFTVFSPLLDPENNQSTVCTITGQTVITADKTATTGTSPLGAVAIELNGETLATSKPDGTFSFTLSTGVYELVFHYNYGFDRTVYLVVTDDDIDMGAIPLIACDWNKDKVINDDDYTLFRYVVGSKEGSPSYLSFVDMNKDGTINVKDLVYMNTVKGLDASSFNYPEIIIGV